ncbi:hypothetical protein [Phenylobacterium immobile]|uniref:hypothetical protein n=1 Tax=Phenylobacterium immobile TaxID=21 RepID=UPI000AA80E40|nr:hypothetical protein [Phenylobacterium immobile]
MIAFIVRYWRPLAGALVLLAVVSAVYLKGRSDAAASWRPRLQAAQLDLSRCKDSRLDLEASIAAQNAALAEKSQQDAQRLADAAKALSAASKGRASVEARANRLLTTPTGGTDACARAVAAREAVLKELK